MSEETSPPTEVKKALEKSRRRSLEAGSTFHFAFRMLPELKRDSLFAVYHFCRLVDDAVDSEASPSEKSDRLSELEQGLEQEDGGDLWQALAWVRKKYKIPDTYFHELIDGARSDIGGVKMRNFEELDRYCYRVAGTVGLITLHIFDTRDRELLESGKRLGRAYQYTNILRDVAEDRSMDRCYLPLDLLEEHGARGAWREREMTRGFRAVLEELIEVARGNYRDAVDLLAKLKWRPRVSIALMTAAYSRYLERISTPDYNPWQDRVGLSFPDYFFFFLRGLRASFGSPENCLFV